jgi:uncharacterized protein (TIGR03663 family)
MGGRSDERDDTDDRRDASESGTDADPSTEGDVNGATSGSNDPDNAPSDSSVDDSERTEQRDDESLDEDASERANVFSVLDRFEQVTLFRVVLGITVLALVLRLVSLGARTAHWDEARVAYWANLYTETGSVGYHYEEHGPFVQIVAGRLFEFLGATDFAARLPVAIIGGLMPLGAYLYREHLRRVETIALALILALNSVLLYYSRFMRSDVLVATFMFLAFGLIVRFYDTRRSPYLYVAGLVMGLGFASKENAVLYVVTWVGAAVLLADQYLHSPASDVSGLDRIRARYASYRRTVKRAVLRLDYLIGSVLVFLATLVFMFAPRGYGTERRYNPNPTGEKLNLGTALWDPTKWWEFSKDTLQEQVYDGFTEWFSKSSETTIDTYIHYLQDGFLKVLIEHTPLLVLFAILGILTERYARDRSRPLVMFFTYIAAASLVGYPLGADVTGSWAWVSTHVVLPLTVPAAVGLTWVYRQSKGHLDHGNAVPTIVAALVVAVAVLSTTASWLPAKAVVVLAGPAIAVGIALSDRWTEAPTPNQSVDTVVVVALVVAVASVSLLWFWMIPFQSVYADNQADDNELVQFAQPHSDMKPVVNDLRDIAPENEGADVLIYYGEVRANYDDYYALTERDIRPEVLDGWLIHPLCSRWANSQPLNWYFAATDTNATCEREEEVFARTVTEEQPPMVIVSADDETVPTGVFEEYESQNYYMRTVGKEVIVYTHESWADS